MLSNFKELMKSAKYILFHHLYIFKDENYTNVLYDKSTNL